MRMNNIENKSLPHNPDAERSVLGAIILDDNSILKAVPILPEPSYFFLRENQLLYGVMLGLTATNKPIDTVSIVEALDTSGHLDAAGGAVYVSTLADGIPRVNHIEHYARIVREKARGRQIIHFTERLQKSAFEGSLDFSA